MRKDYDDGDEICDMIVIVESPDGMARIHEREKRSYAEKVAMSRMRLDENATCVTVFDIAGNKIAEVCKK